MLVCAVMIAATIMPPQPSNAEASGQRATPSLYNISEWRYTSSEICKRCHPDHYDMWSHSMHALAVDDPIFKVSYLQSQVMGGEKVRKYCLNCHAPLARPNRDYALLLPDTREGVTCDFCHTVTAVHIGRTPSPYDNNPGVIKYGPLEASTALAHETEQSDLFKTSEFCGGCHELVNEHGVTVMSTYSEWLAGPYSDEGVHCQNCHMPLSMKATAVTIDGDTTTNLAHDHRFQGGHSQINLKNAADLEFYVEIFGNTAQIKVFITNKESGHKLPTGMPARKVILNVRVSDQAGNLIAQPTRIYRKVLVDKDGLILEGNGNQILNAVNVFNDNRIAPKERRKEEFLIDLPRDVTAINVTTELLYEYETPVMYTQKIQTEMATHQASYTIREDVASNTPDKSRFWLIIILIVIGSALLLAFLKWIAMSKKKTIADQTKVKEVDQE